MRKSIFGYFDSLPPNRRHKFRDAKCAATTFAGWFSPNIQSFTITKSLAQT